MANPTNVISSTNSAIPQAEKEPPKDLLKQTQLQVDELLDISRKNFDIVMEREEKLSDIIKISETLENRGCQFVTQTEMLKRRKWMKRFKRNIFLFLILSLLFVFATCLIIIFRTELQLHSLK